MIYAIDDSRAIRAYQTDGLVVCSFLSPEECKSLVGEQVGEIFMKQPWTPKSLLAKHAECPEALVQALMGKIDKRQLKELEGAAPLHRGFGACCDPCVFHLRGVWKVRQDPRLYTLASALTGTEKLWVDINRSIQKLPGQGEEEFLHWDRNPFATSSTGARARARAVCGKVMYTEGTFYYVPGTHTAEFDAEFRRSYGPHYTVVAGAAKFAIDPAKPDPLGLVAKAQKIVVPAGCVVFWDERLLHGVIKNKTNKIQWGMYVGFFEAGSRPRYEQTCGIKELEDRLASYREGRAPKLWPSFDAIHFYPKRFQNFPRILQGYIDRMAKDHPSITTRTTQAGKVVPHLLPWPAAVTGLPELSSLGRKLLGLDAWPESAAVEAVEAVEVEAVEAAESDETESYATEADVEAVETVEAAEAVEADESRPPKRARIDEDILILD